MADERDIVERLEEHAAKENEIHAGSETDLYAEVAAGLEREAAALIRELDEAMAQRLRDGFGPNGPDWVYERFRAAAARHAARTKRRAVSDPDADEPVMMTGPVRRDWCEEHNRGSLVDTDGLCPDCEEYWVGLHVARTKREAK